MVEGRFGGLCAFHLLSVSEKLPDHGVWKLSALLASDWPDKIRELFSKLVRDSESNPNIDSHDYRGFWLPSVDLRGTRFTKPVYFNEAVFLQEAIFSEATFCESVDFFRAFFRGKTDFLSAGFDGPAYFEQVRFEQVTSFSDSVFANNASFCQAVIGTEVEFANDTFEDEADFCYIKVLKDATIVFDCVDLDKASFFNSNLEKIEFRDVRWFRPTNRKWAQRRRALWDEFRPLEEQEDKRNYQRIAENYRQLVLNYERKRDFESAEDFHIGEMEIRRREAELRFRNPILKLLLKYFNMYALYWQFSRYGTSYWVALGWLLFWVIGVFPLVFLFSGFNIMDTGTGKFATAIAYHLRPDFTHMWQAFSNWGKAVDLSLFVATFQRSRLYQPSGQWAICCLPIESVIAAAQSALLLLAIRRRFKR
ncbi:MAG: hypothetical protein ACYDBH_17095 [Acidobacteriaceae bacterium]